MAIQRAGVPGTPQAPQAPAAPASPAAGLPSAALAPVAPAVSAGPALSTRETPDKPFIELGVMFGQAMGGREPVMQALTNLQNIGAANGCDAVIAVKLLHYPTAAGPAVVAYGTGIRFLPQAPEPADSAPAGGSTAGGLGGQVAPASGAPSGDGNGAG
jgi:hypothetical protein